MIERSEVGIFCSLRRPIWCLLLERQLPNIAREAFIFVFQAFDAGYYGESIRRRITGEEHRSEAKLAPGLSLDPFESNSLPAKSHAGNAVRD